MLDIAGENRVATYQTAKAETHREDEEDALLKQKRRQTRLFKLSDLVKWDDVGDEMDLRCRVKMLGAPSPASIHETRAKSVLPFASAKPRTTSTQRASIEIDVSAVSTCYCGITRELYMYSVLPRTYDYRAFFWSFCAPLLSA